MLTAARLAEICYWAQLGVNWLAVEPSIIEIIFCFFSIFFLHEFDIYISDHMFSNVFAYVYLLYFSIFTLHLNENFLVKIIKISLFFVVTFSHLVECVGLANINNWVMIEIFEYHCWRERGCMMGSRAFIPVAACSGLKEKRAVNLVFLRTINGSKIFGSGEPVAVRHPLDTCKKCFITKKIL